jgi:hypothetical protein
MVHPFWSRELRKKIAKLIRMLSSANDAETLAATRAITRVLKNEAADIHDLANLVLGYSPAPAQSARPPASEKSATPSSARQWSRDHLIRNAWLVSCSICIRHANELTASELSFIRSIERRLKDKELYTHDEIIRLDRICCRFEFRDQH